MADKNQSLAAVLCAHGDFLDEPHAAGFIEEGVNITESKQARLLTVENMLEGRFGFGGVVQACTMRQINPSQTFGDRPGLHRQRQLHAKLAEQCERTLLFPSFYHHDGNMGFNDQAQIVAGIHGVIGSVPRRAIPGMTGAGSPRKHRDRAAYHDRQ